MVCPNIGTEYCGVCEAAPHCQELLALREGEEFCDLCGDPSCEGECFEWDAYEDDYEDDGQPDEYTEWQDVYGGDVEEYGTYGEYDSYDEY